MTWIFSWWGWAVLALIFGILEIVLPSAIFLGFALGAGAVAILLALGLLGGSVPWIMVVFALASLIAWVVLRYVFRLGKGDVKVWTTDIND